MKHTNTFNEPCSLHNGRDVPLWFACARELIASKVSLNIQTHKYKTI